MYKLIAIDIDDTLLNEEGHITPATKEALYAAMERGVTVTLATGRMYASARKIADMLDLNVPLITYQGALVKNSRDEAVLYERTVPQDAAQYVFRYAEQNGYHLQAYHDDTLYAKEDNEKVREYSRISNIPYSIDPDFSEMASKPQTKLLVIDDPQKLDEVSREWKRAIGGQAHITKSRPHYLEVTHPEATKGHALRFLAAHVGCDISQVIAIGDSWNDREMIEAAGLGVAMGNAVDSLKAIADYVTRSNNEEGVRHVIEKFVLSGE